MEVKLNVSIVSNRFVWLVLFAAGSSRLALSSHQSNGPLDQALCKCKKLAKTARILNASLVAGDDLRWLASIFSVDDQVPEVDQFYEHRCTASVIGRSYLLSSASCLLSKDRQRVEFKDSLFAAAGLKHNNHEAYLTESNFRLISEIFIHPKFNESNLRPAKGQPPTLFALKHDLAILKLDASFELGADIAPGCLAVSGETEFEAGLLAAGFGDTTSKEPRNQNRVVRTNWPSMAAVRQTENCSASLTNFDSATSFCAISASSTIKRGDRGGPLHYVGKDKLFIVGILSHSVANGHPTDLPIIYTLVHPHLDWIEQQVLDDRCLNGQQQSPDYSPLKRFLVRSFVCLFAATLLILLGFNARLRTLTHRLRSSPSANLKEEPKEEAKPNTKEKVKEDPSLRSAELKQ